MIVLALVLSLSAGQTCGAPSPARRVPTLRVSGDSLTLNTCVGGGTGPMTTLDANLPGGTTGGWLVKIGGVAGETAAQIRSRYTSEEATACNGERCAHLVLEGGVNSLRVGVTPAATLADMAWVVDDALSKGYAVVWLDVTPYAGWASAGANPVTQATTYNSLWAAACDARASNPRLRCLSNYASFNDPANPGYLLPAYSCDGVHYSQAGMDLLAARIRTGLLALP